MSSFPDEPPPKKPNKPPSSPSSPPSHFSKLDIYIILDIIALVPKRYYPILSCVCKYFADLVRSPEIQKTRALRGLDSVYLSFASKHIFSPRLEWYDLRRHENHQNVISVTSVEFPSSSVENCDSVIAIGPKIFFFGSSNFLIYDTRTGKLCRGSDMMLVRGCSSSVGLVGEKIYVTGAAADWSDLGHDEKILAESFDLKKKIWEVAPVPEHKALQPWILVANASLDRKLYSLLRIGDTFLGMTYDTRDGSCEEFHMPDDKCYITGVCVIANVLYVYCRRFGLMWFDSKLAMWRIVYGLANMKKVRSVAMAEFYGKLAFCWRDSDYVDENKKDVWCRVIALEKRRGLIYGTAERAKLVLTVPRFFSWGHCLSVSND